jgi:hypothetical protein
LLGVRICLSLRLRPPIDLVLRASEIVSRLNEVEIGESASIFEDVTVTIGRLFFAHEKVDATLQHKIKRVQVS